MTILESNFKTWKIHGSIPCGRTQPAFEDIPNDEREDFYRYAKIHPTMTYQLTVSGESMTGAGFYHGDVVFVDCSVEPIDGDIVAVCLNGEYTMKRLRVSERLWKRRIELIAENPRFQPILVGEDDNFLVIGVVAGHYRKIER